ncbi:MAG: zf-HC2 domain-containing protein [Myxococcales bacterium]|nr:zf-HC2 domain-containing protein [Myxococcales bacterium]
MDCEKFQDALMDELYGELDEVTSAALRRHASACSRCAEQLATLRATRNSAVAALAPFEAPPGLEARILEAAREARKVVPIHRAGFVSMAGRWAMRPQTAMAAVFLLMIGSSVVFMKGGSSSMSAVTVTEQGAPAAAEGLLDSRESLKKERDSKGASVAHGPQPPPSPLASATALPVAAATAPAAPPPAAVAAAPADAVAKGRADNELALNAEPRVVGKKTAEWSALADDEARGGPGAARGPARAPSPAAAAAPASPAKAGAVGRASAGSGGSSSEGFADAMAAYRGQRYGDAARLFDAMAAQGDGTAALWAARSEREGSGCSAAVARFDRVATASYGTSAGYDATFEAGRCYRQLGSFEAARNRFARLLTVPSHAPRAQMELDAMSPPRARQAPAATKPADPPPATAPIQVEQAN